MCQLPMENLKQSYSNFEQYIQTKKVVYKIGGLFLFEQYDRIDLIGIVFNLSVNRQTSSVTLLL